MGSEPSGIHEASVPGRRRRKRRRFKDDADKRTMRQFFVTPVAFVLTSAALRKSLEAIDGKVFKWNTGEKRPTMIDDLLNYTARTLEPDWVVRGGTCKFVSWGLPSWPHR